MTTSLRNCWRYVERQARRRTPPLPDRRRSRGRSAPRASSRRRVQYSVERASRGSRGGEADLVVDDDVDACRRCRTPRACDSCSVSMTTPWPAKAASPWIRIGSTRAPVVSPRRSWRARTEPSTTGLTTSRCEGLNASATCTLPPRRAQVRREALVVLHVARAVHVRRCRTCLRIRRTAPRATCRAR